MSRPIRSDYSNDTKGCQLHSDCFTCPFPDCVIPTEAFGNPTKMRQFLSGVRQNMQRQETIAHVLTLKRTGLQTHEIAAKIPLSARQILRILKRYALEEKGI